MKMLTGRGQTTNLDQDSGIGEIAFLHHLLHNSVLDSLGVHCAEWKASVCCWLGIGEAV
jgi:hypothetical protein